MSPFRVNELTIKVVRMMSVLGREHRHYVSPLRRDISAEVERMTKPYGLSEDQAKIVYAILEEQARKADDVAKDNSLSPEEKVHRMLAIKDEETTRVSDSLTPEQRKKYLKDVRPAPPPAGSPAEAPAESISKQAVNR